MDIAYLADHDEFVAELAQWHHEEWAYLRPGDTIEARTRRLRAACGRRQIPAVFVAFAGAELLGSAMLVAHDMATRPAYSPWVAGVFVTPSQRGRGIGTALVRRAVGEAAFLGVARLFLYTPGAEAFYVRLGWQSFERTRYRGVEVVVMFKDVTPSHPQDRTLPPAAGPRPRQP